MPDEKKELEDVDSGWEDDEDDEDDEADEDLDAGWDDAEGVEGQAVSGTAKRGDAPPRVLTPEERAARAARVEARKQRLKAKAAEKAERRKARASAAASKQKKGAPRERVARASAPPKPKRRPEAEPRSQSDADIADAADDDAEIRAEPRVSREPAASAMSRWLTGRTLAIAVVVLLVGGAIAFVLTRR